jgi:hypothetical protein
VIAVLFDANGLAKFAPVEPSFPRKREPMLSNDTFQPAAPLTHFEAKPAVLCHDGRMEKQSYVYMPASSRYGTLYVGVTSDLVRPVWQLREGLANRFTKQYSVKKLVWLSEKSKSRSGSGSGKLN